MTARITEPPRSRVVMLPGLVGLYYGLRKFGCNDSIIRPIKILV